jgi:C1A family cysteine protease
MANSPSNRVYNWKPDVPDIRDIKYKASRPIPLDLLPISVDLRMGMPPVYNQGQIGSCTANALAAAMWFLKNKEEEKAFDPSRLFIYYCEREVEGTVGEDAGAFIRTGVKVLNKQGVCRETTWPYKESKFTRKPTKKAYTQAVNSKVTSYMRVDGTDLKKIKTCLFEGYPIVFGFTVYESFESADVSLRGEMSMPSMDEKSYGGHAVLIVGYDDAKECVIVRNSWGSEWADKGYFYMPYEYVTNPNLADDFWTLRAEG